MKKQIIQRICLVTILIFSLVIPTFAATAQTTDFAGSGESGTKDGVKKDASFALPWDLAIDKDGGILIVDTNNSRIRKVKGDIVSTVSGSSSSTDIYGFPTAGFVDGDNTSAKFNKPRGIAVDSNGIYFVADTGNNAIRRIIASKTYTFSGQIKSGYKDGDGREALFNGPSGIAIDGKDNLYVADTLNNVIRKITADGKVTTFAGKFGLQGGYKDGASKEALFNEPSSLAFDSTGALYVADKR